MRTHAHGKHQTSVSSVTSAQRTHQPGPIWPPLQKASMWLWPCLRRKGVGAAPGWQDSRTAAPFPPRGITTHPRPSRPYQAGLPIPTLQAGLPACPAPLPGPGGALVHLSGTRCLIKPPRKQGQPVGVAEEGAALGHVWPRGFFGPRSNLLPPLTPSPATPHPRKLGSVLPALRGCEYIQACVCMCICVSPSEVGSPSYSL